MDNPDKIRPREYGFAPPLIFEAAVRVGVFGALDSGSKTVAEMAAATGASARGLKSIMNALVGLQLLTRDSAGKFGLTQQGAPSIETAKHSSPPHAGWLDLAEIVRTGRPISGVNRGETSPMGLGDAAAVVEGAKSVLYVTTGAEDFGNGHAVAVIWHLLRYEGLAGSRKLLERAYDALDPGGTVIIGEVLVDPNRRGPVMGLIIDVDMLVCTEKGNTYSFEEIREWLEICGFTNARTVEAPGPSPLIFADKKV